MRRLNHTHPISRLILALLMTSGSGLALTGAATAGTYDVNATCTAWSTFNTNTTRFAVFPSCPRLVARNVVGNFNTPQNVEGGGWKFEPPTGTFIRYVKLNAEVTGGKSWSSHITVFGRTSEGRTVERILVNCTSTENCRRSFGESSITDLEGPIVAAVRCFDQSCPNDGDGPRARIFIDGALVTLFDPSPPAAAVAGGQLTDGGWHGGQRSVNVSAGDNTGVRAVRALINGDGRYSATAGLPCDYSRPLPCGNHENVPVGVNLSGLPDGQHALSAQAEDGSGNAGNSAPQTINVDNTPPLAPVGARLVDGKNWRARNAFTVAWRNPPQPFAPIAGVGYRICPKGQPISAARCQQSSLAGPDLTRVAVKAPGPGAWTAYVWLYDSAGNSSADNVARVGGIRLIAGRRAADGSRRTRTRLRVARGKARERRNRPLDLGQKANVSGRLRVGRGRAGLRRRILVYRRVNVEGARFRLVDKVHTTKRGRFVFRAGAGPSRTLRFVFPGTDEVQGRIADLRLKVRAKLSIRRDQRKLRNGEAVHLKGRLRGGEIPPSGARLELQVETRGRWRPFETARTDRKGRWSLPYRFETVTGRAKFRFRAVLRKQPTYPYTARSRTVGVLVRGL